MTWLFTSDIHLSDRPKDEHRFGLFPWLAKQQEKYSVSHTFILGDITENKDKHSSVLVNRIVEGLVHLRGVVYILRGNHDGNDPECPYFKFLSRIPGILFVRSFSFLGSLGVALVPHCRTQALLDQNLDRVPTASKAILLHNTFEGAIAESGAHLSGLAASHAAFKGAAGVWAGDVHKPQCVGPVTYVGSPYHVRFGDNFTPRVMLLEDGKHVADLHFPSPRKWSLTITDPQDIANHEKLKAGDQIKVRVKLTREELVEWTNIRRSVLAACRDRNLEVFGIDLEPPQLVKRSDVKGTEAKLLDHRQIFDAYCQHERLPSAIRLAGREIMNEN